MLSSQPMPRQVGAVNWLGFWTLYEREVRRFLKVSTQTVVAPVATTLVFLAIFLLARPGGDTGIADRVGGTSFAEFLVPGLVMMAMTQNAFANTSSSIMISKLQGNIVDVLMPPLSAAEMTLAFGLGGLTRGLVVGVTVALSAWLFVPLHIASLPLIFFHAVAASLLLSLVGFIGGIWAEKFDHIAAVTNFVVTPLSFLSGTFYSIEKLPEFWRIFAHINPFFYMIDGFRCGFIGHADGSLAAGIVVMTATNALLLGLCLRLVGRGYKLKA